MKNKVDKAKKNCGLTLIAVARDLKTKTAKSMARREAAVVIMNFARSSKTLMDFETSLDPNLIQNLSSSGDDETSTLGTLLSEASSLI